MWNIQWRKRNWRPKITAAMSAALAITVGVLAFPASVSAAGGTVLPVEVFGRDVVSVGIPVVTEGEKSPFDFILDPQGLLYETNAMRYGGGTVEEGASLLFHNSAGGYDFSSYSDRLTVTNQSTVPVTVTISAHVSNLDGVGIAGSGDFLGDETQSIYLALVDDEGNIQPISANGDASFSWIMQAAPENAYVYTINEEEHTYECALSRDPASIDFDTYSFGLLGACNPNADWKGISIHPVVTVTWRVDPLLPEQEKPLEEQSDEMLEEQDRKSEDSELDLDSMIETLSDKDQQEKESSSEKMPEQKDNALPNSTVDKINDDTPNDVGDAADSTTVNSTDNADKTSETTANSASEATANSAGGAENNVDNKMDKTENAVTDAEPDK